ncbi:MAG: isoprenylcysteine carboxylmethyltransferase family protein [Gemmatimonadaceae bacterium]
MTWSLTAKRLRLPLGFLLSFAYLALVRPTGASLGLGAGIALIGLAVRAWASGHIMKNDRLATSGPYAHTRNPLYFGSFLLAAGFAIAAHWSLLLLVIAFFVLIYGPTMERERANISGRFPDAYETYQQNVPAFVPRLTPWSDEGAGTTNEFSWGLYMKHGEWKALLGYLGAVAWLFLRASGRV